MKFVSLIGLQAFRLPLELLMHRGVTLGPMLHRFGTDPAHLNTWVLFHPYVLVPVSLVLTALSAHLVITRKLLNREAF